MLLYPDQQPRLQKSPPEDLCRDLMEMYSGKVFVRMSGVPRWYMKFYGKRFNVSEYGFRSNLKLLQIVQIWDDKFYVNRMGIENDLWLKRLIDDEGMLYTWERTGEGRARRVAKVIAARKTITELEAKVELLRSELLSLVGGESRLLELHVMESMYEAAYGCKIDFAYIGRPEKSLSELQGAGVDFFRNQGQEILVADAFRNNLNSAPGTAEPGSIPASPTMNNGIKVGFAMPVNRGGSGKFY
jgi:hypothetical protein